MTTLFDVTLDLARHARGIHRYKITSSTDTGYTVSSPKMKNRSGEYTNGTLWIVSGDYSGNFTKIDSAINDRLTIEDKTLHIDSGDIVAICPWIDFDLDDLIDAVNSVLYRYPVYKWDKTLKWNSNKYVYELPEGVSDVKQVFVENTLGNGTYTLSHCWTEENGQLRFHTSQGLYQDGGEIQIGYRKMHGEVFEATDEIDPAVDVNYLRTMAFLYLWRQVIIVQHKDNPVAVDMYNECKMYESEFLKFNMPERNIPLRSFFTR